MPAPLQGLIGRRWRIAKWTASSAFFGAAHNVFPSRGNASPGTESRVLGASDCLQAELLDRLLSHFDLAHLARDGHREAVHDLHEARDLVMRELAGAERA